MFIGTKAYTLNSLINEVASVSRAQGKTKDSLVTALSPRRGYNSVKMGIINDFLGGNLDRVLIGNTSVSGKTPRARLLRALKDRKTSGVFFN